MKNIILIICCLTFQLSAEKKIVKGSSLQFQTDSKVELLHKKEGNVFNFQWGPKLLPNTIMLYPSNEGKEKKDIPDIAMKLKKDLPKSLDFKTDFYKVKVTSTTTKEIDLGFYKGTEVKCTTLDTKKKKSFCSMLVLWDGKNIWYAAITSKSEKEYQEAIKILKSTKKL